MLDPHHRWECDRIFTRIRVALGSMWRCAVLGFQSLGSLCCAWLHSGNRAGTPLLLLVPRRRRALLVMPLAFLRYLCLTWLSIGISAVLGFHWHRLVFWFHNSARTALGFPSLVDPWFYFGATRRCTVLRWTLHVRRCCARFHIGDWLHIGN
jgi:hypothetical protein